MFQTMAPAEPDKILQLIGLFREDRRPEKLDLGVGVYKDPARQTPVMAAVRKAELKFIESQVSKSYLGLEGHTGFNAAITRLALGDHLDPARTRTIQAPGGSGAIRILAELLASAQPDAVVYLSDPTWPNHLPTMTAAGLNTKTYRYFDPSTGGVRFDSMLESLSEASPGDIVVLHGCCHNPTGANIAPQQWPVLAEFLVEKRLMPFVDMAYQGFGDGLDVDAGGLRCLADVVPELVAAISCSKNFGVYCDRVGAAILIGRNSRQTDTAFGQLKSLARRNYSMPPNHAAAAVFTVLEDSGLRSEWHDELDGMRTRMLELRTGFADALRKESGTGRFDFLASHRGMFSRLGLSAEQVARLRSEKAVYMVGDSRINVAGLPDPGLDRLAESIVSVMSA